MISLLLFLLTGVTVWSNWISVSDSDVSSVLTPMTDWAWSFFNVLIKFAPVFVVLFFLYLILNWFKNHKHD